MLNIQIIKKLINANIKNKNQFSRFKREISKKYKIPLLKNTELLTSYYNFIKKEDLKEDPAIISLFRIKKIRSLSGVAIITIATKPFFCPGKCIYCPSQPKMPKSYLKNEPAIMRAIRNNFAAFKQVRDRIKALEKTGHPTDKLEIIIIGGTWSSLPKNYQKNFIKKIFDAANGKVSKNLESAQKVNEKSKHRIVGITIETRPDFINEKEILWLRKLGVTRVEIGVQSIYDDVLKINNRGHDIKTTVKITKLLKDTGFKVCYHLMPNLPGSNFEKDLAMFKTIFTNENFQPDMLKIYPCVVLKKTKLYDWYKNKKYKTYSEKKLKLLLKKILAIIPYYCRVQRVIRDIPASEIIAGSKTSNLRDVIESEMEKEGIKCKDIRMREIKEKYNPKEKVFLFRKNYKASEGEEIFLSYETKNREKLYSLLRLRIPSYSLKKQKFFIKTLQNSAIIREVHTYGQMIPLKEKGEAPQHKGLGKKLIAKAEKIAKKEYGLKKIAIISGIGVRNYYRKLGYKLSETYMVKTL